MFGASTPFCLTAPPTPTLFGVFAFYHRRSLFNTGVCTPSIRCLYNNSLSILACFGKVFACCLYQEHKRLHVVQTLTVSALSFIWEHLFALHLVFHYSTSLDPTGTSAQSPCALVQFLFSRFLPIPCLCLTAAHHVTTPVQVKNRVPIFIPLLYFSSIIRVFINSPFEKSQSSNLTSLEKSSLHQILDHTEPNCSLVPSSC
jgi:hypothetical protein